MSKLDELIADLCPDGVEFKTLGEIAINIYRGSGIKRDEVTEEGIPCVRYGEIYTTYGIWFKECVSHTVIENVKSPKFFEYGDILFAITGERVEDIAKSTTYVGNEKCLAGGDIVVLKHNQNPKYISYALATMEARKQKCAGKVKSKVVHSSVPSIKSIIVPLPPLPVQSEIVCILDNLTELTEKLTAELTMELAVRKNQFEYYRDETYKFKNRTDVKWITLSELGTIIRGKRFVRADIKDDGISCFHYGDLYTYYGITATETKTYIGDDIAKKMRFANKNDVVIVGAGENDMDIGVGVAWLGDNEAAVHDACYILSHNINPVYISHFLRTSMYHWQIKKYVSSGKICSISADGIGKAIIPVPSLEEQKKIADVLESFDALRNDIISSLQAEIAARQKQYEYYRDKLLTFKELS